MTTRELLLMTAFTCTAVPACGSEQVTVDESLRDSIQRFEAILNRTQLPTLHQYYWLFGGENEIEQELAELLCVQIAKRLDSKVPCEEFDYYRELDPQHTLSIVLETVIAELGQCGPIVVTGVELRRDVGPQALRVVKAACGAKVLMFHSNVPGEPLGHNGHLELVSINNIPLREKAGLR